MLVFEPWKKWLIALVLFVGAINLVPNFFAERVFESTQARNEIRHFDLIGQPPPPELQAAADQWPGWAPAGVVNLGLDLQGGSYFELELDLDAIYADRMDALRSVLGQTLREAGVRRYERIRAEGPERIAVDIRELDQVDAALGAVRALAQPVETGVLGPISSDIVVAQEGERTVALTLTDEAKDQIAATTVAAAIEVVRTRVDSLGTREPTIQRRGVNRILLQIPGANDVDVDALTKVARLEFRMVAMDVGSGGEISTAQADVVSPPPGVEFLEYDPELNPDRAGLSVAVSTDVDITGDSLADAGPGRDQFNQVGVNIRFDGPGARTFGQITSQFTGQRFAMVLDGQVLSAPSINEPIVNGAAIITGNFTQLSANALAVNLRSGSLPTSLTVEESFEIGPELGADSVAAGQLACIIGFMLVLIFMAASYGLFGVLADVALLLNVLLIFGALSLFGATLTLPGIAGIVLTIGMAVDANVLVFERIREELRSGRAVVKAIETGYQRALSAIIDANVTTFIAALILFVIGSGPVRGFAVTLGIGIVTSVFTAVMLTRFFVATWYQWKRPKALAL